MLGIIKLWVESVLGVNQQVQQLVDQKDQKHQWIVNSADKIVSIGDDDDKDDGKDDEKKDHKK